MVDLAGQDADSVVKACARAAAGYGADLSRLRGQLRVSWSYHRLITSIAIGVRLVGPEGLAG